MPATLRRLSRAIIEKIIGLADAEGLVDEAPLIRGRTPESALLKTLLSLDDGDLRKAEILMFAGRDRENILDLEAEVDRDPHDRTAHHIAEKLPALAAYLPSGLRTAAEQTVYLDGDWRTDLDEDQDEYPEVPESERAECDQCGRSVPEDELQAFGAGGQESPMICARCWHEIDDEARRENADGEPPN